MIAISIEKLMRWAVCDEWPKERSGTRGPTGIGSGWGAVASYVQMLAVIDENRWGVVPDAGGSGDPHPDAVVLAEVVAALREVGPGGVVMPSPVEAIDPEWLIGDMVARVADRQGDAAAREALTWLRRRAVAAIERVLVVGADGLARPRVGHDHAIVRAAVLGAPEWRVGPTAWDQVRHANGAPVWRRRARREISWDASGAATAWGEVEVDAQLVNGRRSGDAYPAMAMVPWDGAVLEARAAHIVWRAVLRAVAAAVEGRLVAHRVVDGDGVALPWMTARRGGRVLVDLAVAGVTGEEGWAGRRAMGKNFRRKA